MTILNKLLLASKNEKKAKELKEILEPYGIQLITASDVDIPDVEETGATFKENAILKAESGALYSGIPTLSDDSGLCVDALDGRPGVYSARYGGYEKLLDEMKDVEFAKRGAHFTCSLALKIPGKDIQVFEGTIQGFILTHPRGKKGFGYDPVFLPEGETLSFAEMLSDRKNSISHRGRALKDFISYLQSAKNT